MTLRKIVVEIDEDAYEDIKQEIGIKLALDNMEGATSKEDYGRHFPYLSGRYNRYGRRILWNR